MGVPTQITAMIRRTTEGFLTETCTIERESSTRGKYGEPIHDWEIVDVDVPCRVISMGQRFSSGIAEAAAAETMKREYRFIVANTVTLAVNMRVTVGAVVYNITRIENQLTDEAFHHAIMQGRD